MLRSVSGRQASMETAHVHFVRMLATFNYWCTVRCFSYDMPVFSTLKTYFGKLCCPAKKQTNSELCDEGTPVDPPMEPSLSDGTSVDPPSLFEGTSVDPPSLFEGTSVDPPSFFEGTSVDLPTADPSLSDGTSVDLLPPSTSEETEEALQSSPCYSSCKGSSDELIKYLGVPAPTTFQYLQDITKCLFHFNQPFLRDDFERLVKKRAVSLEMAMFDGGKTVSTLIRVDNRGYHKDVIVRMTADEWKTQQDVPARYVSSDSEYNSDKFKADFDVTGKGNVEFAILYQVNGNSFWDNNEGDNFTITFN